MALLRPYKQNIWHNAQPKSIIFRLHGTGVPSKQSSTCNVQRPPAWSITSCPWCCGGQLHLEKIDPAEVLCKQLQLFYQLRFWLFRFHHFCDGLLRLRFSHRTALVHSADYLAEGQVLLPAIFAHSPTISYLEEDFNIRVVKGFECDRNLPDSLSSIFKRITGILWLAS